MSTFKTPMPPVKYKHDIVLYDQACTRDKSVSPLAIQVRMALKYKGIPYKVVLIEYADIPRILRELDMPLPAPDARYRVPAICHLATQTKIMDANTILLWLNEAYPETPKIFISPSHPEEQFHAKVMPHLQVAIVPRMLLILPPLSAEAWRRDHEAVCGHALEVYLEIEEKYFDRFAHEMRDFGETLRRLRGSKKFLYSDEEPSMVDFLIAGTLLAAEVIYKPAYERTISFRGFYEAMVCCMDYADEQTGLREHR